MTIDRGVIRFFLEDIRYTLPKRTSIKAWITQAIREEKKQLRSLNVVLCSDAYLQVLNQQYLHHDTFTDIITFDYAEEPQYVVADLFISIERVKENAKTFRVAHFDELCRVMIHGTLHLLGYADKTSAHKKQMTARENYYLALRTF